MVIDTTSYAQAIGLVATLEVCHASGFDSVVAQEEIGSLGTVRRGGAMSMTRVRGMAGLDSIV